MADPLDTASLLSLLPALLHPGTSSPLPNPTDAVAALVHTIHTALLFRLVSPATPVVDQSFSETEVADPSEDMDDSMSEMTAVEQEDASQAPPGRLAEDWNSQGENTYIFHYKHDQSAMNFHIRVGKMGSRVQIDAMAEDGEPHTLSLVLTDYVEPQAFPIASSATASTAGRGSSVDGLATTAGFKSLNVVKGLVEKYQQEIISQLLPGLELSGYKEAQIPNPRASVPARNQSDTVDPNPHTSRINPLAGTRSPYSPASVGHRDLDPLANMRPAGSFNPNADGGGMYVDFNHPLFDGRRRGLDPDIDGPGGSIQPPGARWDPVGPGSGPGGSRPFPGPGGNPLSGYGRTDRWGDELAPPGEFGPDLNRMGGSTGGPLGGGSSGLGGNFGGGFGRANGFGGRNQGFGGGGGGFGGGNMYM